MRIYDSFLRKKKVAELKKNRKRKSSIKIKGCFECQAKVNFIFLPFKIYPKHRLYKLCKTMNEHLKMGSGRLFVAVLFGNCLKGLDSRKFRFQESSSNRPTEDQTCNYGCVCGNGKENTHLKDICGKEISHFINISLYCRLYFDNQLEDTFNMASQRPPIHLRF